VSDAVPPSEAKRTRHERRSLKLVGRSSRSGAHSMMQSQSSTCWSHLRSKPWQRARSAGTPRQRPRADGPIRRAHLCEPPPAPCSARRHAPAPSRTAASVCSSALRAHSHPPPARRASRRPLLVARLLVLVLLLGRRLVLAASSSTAQQARPLSMSQQATVRPPKRPFSRRLGSRADGPPFLSRAAQQADARGSVAAPEPDQARHGHDRGGRRPRSRRPARLRPPRLASSPGPPRCPSRGTGRP